MPPPPPPGAAVTVKPRLPDSPPPGAGVNTLTDTERALATSAAEMLARSCVLLTKVVVRLAPFQRTTDEGTKPLPLTVRVSAPLPAAVLAGARLLTTGAGGPEGEEPDGRAGTV